MAKIEVQWLPAQALISRGMLTPTSKLWLLQFQEYVSRCEDLVTLPGIHDPHDNVAVPDKSYKSIAKTKP